MENIHELKYREDGLNKQMDVQSQVVLSEETDRDQIELAARAGKRQVLKVSNHLTGF